MKRLVVISAMLATAMNIGSAMASESVALKQIDVDTSQAARQRGAETVISTCMLCHSLKYLKFSDLDGIGMSKENIESLLMDQHISDRMNSLTPIEIRKESYGKVPPDLSLMAIAREHGPQYVYSLLTGFYNRDDGEVGNHVFPGIKMPDALGYADTAEGSSDRADTEAQARDVVAFLTWAADPNAGTRHTIGVYVIIYLIIMTALLYRVKKRVWRKLNASTADH
jgi:ubiquinol-cytochrome c reductase cytochrome c1 subunit